MRNRLPQIFFFLLLPCLAFAATPPNVVLIVADDLGYGDLGCYGSKDIRTPNLDRLAHEGVRFTNFYANASECSPTRTALLTGRYQQRVGGLECAIGFGNVGRYDDAIRLAEAGQLGLPPTFTILPSVLKEYGYDTAIIGKWHLGDRAEFHPNLHGFDLFIGVIGGAVDYFHHTEPKGDFLGTPVEGRPDLFRNAQAINRLGDYLTNLISDEALQWIDQRQPDAHPFFLYLPYTAPHTPYQTPDDWQAEPVNSEEWNKGSRPAYVQMVEALDSGIGQVLAALKKKGLRENTVVVFFSDNGPTRHGDTGGLRGGKGQLFEGGIKVPCIVRWPARIPDDTVCTQTCVSMDLTASLVALSGTLPPDGKKLDGIDILDHVIAKRADFSRRLFWRQRRGTTTRKAVRDGHFKYVRTEDTDRNSVEEFLFDLSKDPAETIDLSEESPRQLEQIKRQFSLWEDDVKSAR